MNGPGPVYEVTFDIDRDILDDVDAWLSAHAGSMLAMPGVVETRVLRVDDDNGPRARRVARYQLDSDSSLAHFVAKQAETMQRSSEERFGDRFSTSRQVLRSGNIHTVPTRACLNCGKTLSGQYCGHCGQRARDRLISLWELLSDAFGDLFEIDSRLWRTLIPLAVRPGKLTADYLRGRRARFMPPFRTYLVLSLLFFVFAFFDPQQEFDLLFAGPTTLVTDDNTTIPEMPDAEVTAGRQISGVDCTVTDEDIAESPAWLARRLTPERLSNACENILADGARTLIARLIDNLPPGLYVLLPLIALFLKLLYPLSRRYYVEHLLFVVHFHAFLFLALSLQLLMSRIGDLLPTFGNAIVSMAIPLYIPVYLYKALRRVYGQRHLVTAPKYVVLAMAYLLSLGIMLGVAAVIAVLSL